MNANIRRGLVLAGVMVAAGAANAAAGDVDTTAATAGITAAGTAVGVVITALTGYQVVKWAAMQVKRMFGR